MAAEEDNSTVPIPEPEFDDNSVITLTTHQGQFGADPIPIKWGAATSAERGPVIATVRHSSQVDPASHDHPPSFNPPYRGGACLPRHRAERARLQPHITSG